MGENGLSLAAELVAAVKAGEELDLSARAEVGQMVPASNLRDILERRIVDERGAGAIRLRGAVIVGDLDLSHIRTGMTVELTNCQVTRICLNGASIRRFTVRETDPEKPRWLETAHEWRGRIGKESALITALLFSYVVIKVVWIARGDIQTALGIFNSAGLASVIAGGLLSALPLISAATLGVATFQLSKSWPFIKAFPFIRRRDTTVWILELAAASACFFLTPWPIMAAGALLGFVSGCAVHVIRAKRLFCLRLKWLGKHDWRAKAVKVAGIASLALVSLVVVVNPLLYAVWLPHETLTLAKPHGQLMVGHVLSDSNGWISLLRTKERHIYRFRSENVTARVLCTAKQPMPMPYVPDLIKSPSPLYRILSSYSPRADGGW
jgi:hypothetical protein